MNGNPNEHDQGLLTIILNWGDVKNFINFRGGSSTGAAGAFAPAEIWERVQCTRPEKDKESYELQYGHPKTFTITLKSVDLQDTQYLYGKCKKREFK